MPMCIFFNVIYLAQKNKTKLKRKMEETAFRSQGEETNSNRAT
jgi:hypothetical protein